jgi:hypothetical protein
MPKIGAKLQTRTLDEKQIADLCNARGCGVPWPVLSKHYGIPVAELQRLSGQPQWKDIPEPVKQRTLFDAGGGR